MTRQERARRARRLGQVELLETRALMTVAAAAPLPDVNLSVGAAAPPVNLGAYFHDSTPAPNFAIFDTTLGTIPVLLTPSTTPRTVANFESYVGKGAYANSVVHRSVPGFVWQAGGYQLTSSGVKPTATDAPVQNEFGASNVRGTIAMAKLGGNPNSATSQFFFNESDSNAANLDNQNGGFTVFGRVVGASGLAVMDAVANAPVPSPGPLPSPLDSAPLLNYQSGTTVQGSNLVLIKNVTIADQGFSAQSSAPGVASAWLEGNQLVVIPVSAGTATITVAGYGSDGSSATETFKVNVSSAAAPSGTAPPTATPPETTPPTATPPETVVPISVTIPTKPAATARPSDLAVAVRGGLPVSAVAGQRARIQQTVLLTASTNVSQRERVDLILSGASGGVTIASVSPTLRLRGGRPSKITLSARKLDADTPPGTYRVLVSATDPDGANTTVDTGRTLVVLPPRSRAPRRFR